MKITSAIQQPDHHALLYGEWLVTNGLGGYASGSLSGSPTRKYHGLLTAALPAPFGRTVMLNYVADFLILPDKREIPLSFLQTVDNELNNAFPLVEFRLENSIPIWKYEIEGIIVKKSLFLVHRQNTLHVSYKILSPFTDQLQIKWRPYLNFRFNEEEVNTPKDLNFDFHAKDHMYEILMPPYPSLKLFCESEAIFIYDSNLIENVFYPIEAARGYASVGKLQSPGYYLIPLQEDKKITFITSIEPWSTIHALNSDEAKIIERLRLKNILKTAGPLNKSPTTAKLSLAADQFIMTPMTRPEDLIRLQAAGEDVKSIIAGFPWFTDWGRDTMISLEGLTLVTGRFRIADSILRTFSYYIKDGLIPNMFPDGATKALYHTADATLWYFHAIDRYIQYTGDIDILEILLPKLRNIIDWHIKGTHFGIRVDDDGLLIQGQEGFQLTWMDAKVGNWVVTPRRGKAVEINALWYNALKLLEEWTEQTLEITQKCYESFNKRFWFEQGNYLYDVIDTENGIDDSALRPNQLFAISLKYPILEKKRWKAVLDVTEAQLLTPFGLRTLSPSHPDYQSTYDGDLRARDAAYHQGTVWPWLLGPFIDSWLKVYPNDYEKAYSFLKAIEDHLDKEQCLGTIGEIFDASPPYHARGCFSQAWSVAEILRCIVKTTSR